MKKLIALLALCLSVNTSFAEEPYLKNEISASYGIITNTEIGELGYEIAFASIQTKRNATYSGGMNLDYIHNFSRKFGVGVTLTYEQESAKLHTVGKNPIPMGKEYNHYCSVIPEVKYNWITGKHFGFYSKAGAGIVLDFGSYDPENNSSKKHNTDYIFGFNTIPIGVEAGTENFRCFLEGGIGFSGVVQLGLRYKF